MTDHQRQMHGLKPAQDRDAYQRHWRYILDQIPTRALQVALGQENGADVVAELEYFAALLGLINDNTAAMIGDTLATRIETIERAAYLRIDDAIRTLFKARAGRASIMLAAQVAGSPYLPPAAVREHVERRLTETVTYMARAA